MRLRLCLLCGTGGLVAVFLLLPVLTLRVGERGPLLRVSPGDRFTLCYTHSMYGVEVRENFRIGREDFTLCDVESSPAALEYFGIVGPGPDPARRSLRAFTVPAGSTGNHELRLNGWRVRLGARGEEEGRTTVVLERISLARYLRERLRR